MHYVYEITIQRRKMFNASPFAGGSGGGCRWVTLNDWSRYLLPLMGTRSEPRANKWDLFPVGFLNYKSTVETVSGRSQLEHSRNIPPPPQMIETWFMSLINNNICVDCKLVKICTNSQFLQIIRLKKEAQKSSESFFICNWKAMLICMRLIFLNIPDHSRSIEIGVQT